MKKVLVGAGIGCGALVLLGIIGVVVAGYWVKEKVGGTLASVQQASAQAQAQQKVLAELEKSYPYTPPEEGEVPVLEESRLLAYLDVRETALPVFQEFDQKSEAFQEQHEGDEDPDLGAAMQAIGMATELFSKVRAAYIQGLKQHRMSPSEFQTITRTLYTSLITDATGKARQASVHARAALEQTLEELRAKLEDETLSEEARTALEQQEELLSAQFESFPPLDAELDGSALSEQSKAATAANLALLEKHKERIESAANLALDGFLLGDFQDDFDLLQGSP
jgi:hypothetical protein